ncbi:phosphotransferase enzyme family protein [Demequina silvatica]|uniref:phosphotransferase enzyme family protein n=1 Tax=Demequina silvatica TaxID=1638988 RepID=UPI000AEA5118|nr:phosphotransferase [Demequina silvatica]
MRREPGEEGATLTVRRALGAHGIADVSAIALVASEADVTAIVSRDAGTLVVKVSDADRASVSRQAALLRHLEVHAPGLAVPRVLPTLLGEATSEGDGGRAMVTTFCPGGALEDVAIDADVVRGLAASQATMVRGLATATADTPVLHAWSIEAFPEHADALLDLAPGELRGPIARLRDAYRDAEPILRNLPRQTIHGDLNLSNVLVVGSDVTGILDFGDAVVAPVVLDVAVAACYLGLALGDLQHELVELYIETAGEALELGSVERSLVPLLAACRAAMVVLLGRSTARTAAHPDYQLRYDRHAVEALMRLADAGALGRLVSTTAKESL